MTLFETRYFWAVFTGKDEEFLKKLRTLLQNAKSAFASSVSIYEVYKLTLAHEGKAVADLRVATIKKDFTMVDVSPEIAEEGARMSHRLKVPMADALIMATAKQLHVPCVTDDPHFSEVKRIWI
jgi:predicted nucleic acid-binding protein